MPYRDRYGDQNTHPDPSVFDLISALRAAGEQLHVLAADALASSRAEAERLRERVEQLESIARLNLETILAMQIAAAETEREQFRSVTR